MKSILILGAAFVAAGASAQSLYSTNFESPWSASTNGLSVISGANTAQGWDTGTTGTTIVANGQTNAGGVTAQGGTQMLRMTTSTSATSANWGWKDISGAWAARTAGNDVVHASVSFFIPATNNRSTIYGLQAYTTNAEVLGEIVFEPNFDTTNSGIFFDNGLVAGQGWTIDKTVMRGSWNTIDMYLDYTNLIGEALLTIGGTTLDLGGITLDPTVAAAGGLGDVDFYADNISTTQTGSTAASNSVYFDNFSVDATSKVVPEPASFAVMGLGLIGLVARRRRK